MNRLLPAALLSCAAVFLSNSAWSFQGFDLFAQIQHAIECARKPGTDYVTCSNKTEEDQEQTEEAEQQASMDEKLIPYVELPAQSVDADYDYVWSHIQSYDITLELEPTFQECNFTGWTDQPYEDVQYKIDLRDLNDDEYDDYLVVAFCHSDIYYKGKRVSREYDADMWAEPFVAMFCGSEDGLYNCTEELTGHKDIINVGGDILPGKADAEITLFDFNGDGIKDAIFPQNRDFGKGITFHQGSEWFEAYFDLMGMTRQEVIDTCAIKKTTPNDDTCWQENAQLTYAISGPDGKWEIKTFDIPHIWDSGNVTTELYFKDGEYHVNFRMYDSLGYTNWHVFNPDTNEFDFVAIGHKREPWDISKNWNQYRLYDNNSKVVENATWKQIGNKKYRVETNDHSLGKGGVPGTYCGDWWDRNYDECQFDQLHILSKNKSGNVTKVMEYNVEDWIDEKRKVQIHLHGDGSGDPDPWDQAPAVSYNLHGYWVNLSMGPSINTDIIQLETRTDAPWYLIVSMSGRNDIRNPGEKFVPEIIHNCQQNNYLRNGTVDDDDERCWQFASAITFKYLIDFESNTLTYAGTLLEEEYPFMWIGLDGWGPDRWVWEDHNNDGWKDIIVVSADKRFVFMSDYQGTYRYADIYPAMPIMSYGRNDSSQISDVKYDSNSIDITDFSGDGLTDYTALISGDTLGELLQSEWRGQADSRLNDLYEPGRTYLDVVHGEYDLLNEADVLDYVELKDRVSECIDMAVAREFTLFQARRCYTIPWRD